MTWLMYLNVFALFILIDGWLGVPAALCRSKTLLLSLWLSEYALERLIRWVIPLFRVMELSMLFFYRLKSKDWLNQPKLRITKWHYLQRFWKKLNKYLILKFWGTLHLMQFPELRQAMHYFWQRKLDQHWNKKYYNQGSTDRTISIIEDTGKFFFVWVDIIN